MIDLEHPEYMTSEEMLECVKLLWKHDWRVMRMMPLTPKKTASPDIFEPRESIAYSYRVA